MNFTCKLCGSKHHIDVSAEELERYTLGEKAEKIFKHLEPHEIILLLTGACEECYELQCLSMEENEEFSSDKFFISSLM